MSDRFIMEKQGQVMWLKFNRPERLNAMTIERWGEFDEHLAAIDADRDVRCLVLAGEGRAFLAGHDVGEIREHNEDIESGKLTPPSSANGRRTSSTAPAASARRGARSSPACTATQWEPGARWCSRAISWWRRSRPGSGFPR